MGDLLEIAEGLRRFVHVLEPSKEPYSGRRVVITIGANGEDTREIVWIVVNDRGVFKGKAETALKSELGEEGLKS